MRKATTLLCALFVLLISDATGQTLTFSCGSPAESNGMFSFDVLVTPDASAVGDSLGDMQVYLDYSTAAFGASIAASSSNTVGVDMNTQTTGLYATNVINDNTTSRISLDVSFDDTREGIPPFTPPLFPVELQTGVSVRIMRVTLPVVDAGEMKSLAFNTALMSGQQFYEPPPPSAPVALFSVDPLSMCDTDALPVQLATFSATANGSDVFVSWTTVSERDNTGFEVQQRSNQIGWESIGFVSSTTDDAGGTTYGYTVTDVTPGLHAFRLKQVDVDGSQTFSELVEVSVALSGRYELIAWPNPFSERTSLRVAVAESQQVLVSVYDALGREVTVLLDERVEANQPRTLQWQPTAAATGAYFIRIAGRGFVSTQSIVLVR